jgi:hypothetical protein
MKKTITIGMIPESLELVYFRDILFPNWNEFMLSIEKMDLKVDPESLLN